MKQNITAKSDAARLLMLLVMSLLFVSTLFPSSVYAAEYEKIADLNGKKIGVQLSTTGDLTATDKFGKDSVVQYNKGNDAVMALTQGQIDAVIIDNEPAKSYVAANKGLKILDTEFLNEDYAACISKDNAGLTKAVNKALAELKADGTLQKIVDKYIKA